MNVNIYFMFENKTERNVVSFLPQVQKKMQSHKPILYVTASVS